MSNSAPAANPIRTVATYAVRSSPGLMISKTHEMAGRAISPAAIAGAQKRSSRKPVAIRPQITESPIKDKMPAAAAGVNPSPVNRGNRFGIDPPIPNEMTKKATAINQKR